MTAAYYALGMIAFFVAILASIGLHELGHLIPAKKFGGKVTQYFVGFGPTLWSKQVGETEYGLKAIPLGGYVKIVGMLPPAAQALVDDVEIDAHGKRVQRIRKSNTGMFTQLISDARAAEYELVRPEDSERLFYRMAWWKKVIVMAAGPTVNLVIAFLIFSGIFATFGNPSDERANPVVDRVEACVVPAADNNRTCTKDDPVAPAFDAKLQKGDEFVSFNGVDVTSWQQLQTLIRTNDAGRAVIVVRRDGRLLTRQTNTLVTPRPTDPGSETLKPVGFLGVSPQTYLATGGPVYVLGQMAEMTAQTVQALGTLPVKVFEVGQAIVGVKARDPEGPVSIVGGGRLAGETASTDQFPLTEKLVFLLMLIAGFNFFIGMFNFIPLLPLDGGHIASALWEAVRRRLARVRGRPDPGYVDAARLLPVAYVVASILLVMGVVLIVGDLVVPLHLEG